MWALTRLSEFNMAFHSAETAWDLPEVAASLRFPQGLLVSFALVTPFWTAVGLIVHTSRNNFTSSSRQARIFLLKYYWLTSIHLLRGELFECLMLSSAMS